MDKDESQLMKGVAILLMIFVHLFNNLSNVDLCRNFIFINNEPLVFILSKAANPVSFFLILGGYGLFIVNLRGDKNRWNRLIKLFIHYWIILIVFLIIGHYKLPNYYPGSINKIISNFTAFNTSYNGEMWFLFPYCLLSILSPLIFKLIRQFKAWIIILITLFLHICTSFCISQFGEKYLFHNYWIYNPLLVIHLLFSFCLGALAAKLKLFERLKKNLRDRKYLRLLSLLGIISLVSLNCIFRYNFFYAILIIICLYLYNIREIPKAILIKLGNQSMNMWMIHSWFCYYLFRDFIYSFSYPILIFVILTIISYYISLVINIIALPIERKIMPLSSVDAKPIL